MLNSLLGVIFAKSADVLLEVFGAGTVLFCLDPLVTVVLSGTAAASRISASH